MKQIEKISDKIIFGVIIFISIMMPVIILIRYLGLYFYEPSWYCLNLGPFLWITLPILIFIYGYRLYKNHFKMTKWDILILILILLAYLSTVFAVNVETSLWGEVNREEGLLSLLVYYFLFLTMKTFKNEKLLSIFTSIFLLLGLIQVGIAFEQIYFRSPKLPFFHYPYMAMGLQENPNFFAGYMILMTCFSLGLYLFSEKHKKFHFICTLAFFSGMILSQTTGVFLSFLVTFIGLLLFLWLKKIHIWKKIGAVVVSLILVFLVVSTTSEYVSREWYHNELETSYTIKGDIYLTFTYIQEKIGSLFGLEFTHKPEKPKPPIGLEGIGSGRFTIWQRSVPLIPKYLLLGGGIDCFRDIYPYNEAHYYIDKVHNHYFQILLTNGVFALITYLTLLGMIFFKAIKSNNKNVWIYLLPFVGFSIQLFMNISVIHVTPYYFILMGLLVMCLEKKDDSNILKTTQ